MVYSLPIKDQTWNRRPRQNSRNHAFEASSFPLHVTAEALPE